jgi:hypothetical protein
MTTATQTESHPAAHASPRSRHWLRALHAEWRKLSPNLAIEPLEGETPKAAERRVRLAWTSEQLKSRKVKVESWNALTQNEARFLLKKMREESGSNAAYRASLIARLAVELFGHDWNNIVRERLGERFQLSTLNSLTAAQAHSMIEELLSRIARRDGVEIEEVRARFRSAAAGKT